MPNKPVECPHCHEVYEFPLDALTPEELAPLINQAAGKEDHRHKSADEFADCPECRSWFDKTATKYQLATKEPAASDKEPEPEPEPQMFRSIFKKGG